MFVYFSGAHIEVDFTNAPPVTLLAEPGGDQAQQEGFIGDESGDARPAFEFLVHTLNGVAGARPALMGYWQRIDGEALREVDLHPGYAVGGTFRVEAHSFFEPRLRCLEVGRSDDGTDVLGNFCTHF